MLGIYTYEARTCEADCRNVLLERGWLAIHWLRFAVRDRRFLCIKRCLCDSLDLDGDMAAQRLDFTEPTQDFGLS